MYLKIFVKHIFRRFTDKLLLKTIKFLFNAFSYKFFVIRRFHGNRLVYRLIARLFYLLSEIRHNLFLCKIVIPIIVGILVVALVESRVFKLRFQVAYNIVKTSVVLAVNHIRPIYIGKLLLHKLVKRYFFFGVRRIVAQFRVGNVFNQRFINVAIIPPVVSKQNIQRETLMIPFEKRLYKRFRFFARRILAVKHTVYRYPFFIKSVRNRICVHSVKITHFFVHDFTRAFDNVVPSGQIRFTPFGRNKRLPCGLFNTV